MIVAAWILLAVAAVQSAIALVFAGRACELYVLNALLAGGNLWAQTASAPLGVQAVAAILAGSVGILAVGVSWSSPLQELYRGPGAGPYGFSSRAWARMQAEVAAERDLTAGTNDHTES